MTKKRKRSHRDSNDHFGPVFFWSIFIPAFIIGGLIMYSVSREDQDPGYRGRPDPYGKDFKKATLTWLPFFPLVPFTIWYLYHRRNKKARERKRHGD